VDLEDQMTQWEESSKDSPDRMDALVWALTELTKGDAAGAFLEHARRRMETENVPVANSARNWREQSAALKATRALGTPPATRQFAPN
jgi:hypothetical protein